MTRERPASVPAMSLFPFIAVLLCTMGALLVLLVIFSRAARESARVDGPVRSAIDESQGEAIEHRDVVTLEHERASLAARVAAAEALKREAEERLRTARLRLAGIEENARELRAELDAHVAVIQSLQQPGPPSPDDIDELTRQLEEAERSLSAARKAAEGKPAAYAVVPYVGPNGTRRRPLYIECSFDGVFLQPEGIRLTPGDFEGPPGPGNPLASALRAAREYLVTTGSPGSPEGDQPYPLLIVRPSGVMAYYAARESLSSWGSDFGYQLIDEDWTLSFPPADPVLADVEQQAIDEARARLQWLAQRRTKVETKSKTTYRAATTRGGVVETGGASLLGDRERFEWREGPSEDAPTGGANGSAARGTAIPSRGSGFGQTTFVPGGMAGSGVGTGGPNGGVGQPQPANGSGRSGSPSDATVSGGSSTGTLGDGGDGRPVARTAAADSVPGQGSRIGGAAGAGRGADGAATGSRGLAATGGDGDGGSPFSSAQAGASGSGGDRGSSAQSSTAGSGGSAGQAGGASGSLSIPLAGVRGANWASLATRDRPIPLTRPILVECAANEFRIYDDARRRVVERVSIDGTTESAVDPLVRHVQARVSDWGIAGERMYWRPQLVLAETSDGLRRRQDLERLLEGSGLDTRVRPPEVAPLPTVRAPTGRSVSRSRPSSAVAASPVVVPRSGQRGDGFEVGG